MVANILPTDTRSAQGVGSKGQTISFSESSHVAYQIKADNAGSNIMVANILPTDTPSTQGVGSNRVPTVREKSVKNEKNSRSGKSQGILS